MRPPIDEAVSSGNLGESLCEGLVHLSTDELGSLTCELRANSVLLFVDVVRHGRARSLPIEERQHVLRKIFGDDNGRVVVTRACPFDRRLLRGNHPVEFIVLAQSRDDLVTDADVQWHQIGLVARIRVRNSDTQGARVAERIPGRRDVEPREQRGNDDESKGHDEGDE